MKRCNTGHVASKFLLCRITRRRGSDTVISIESEETDCQTYAILGGYDFHLAFEVESGEVAFQVSQTIERHGLDTETMRTLPVERIGELVDDI